MNPHVVLLAMAVFSAEGSAGQAEGSSTVVKAGAGLSAAERNMSLFVRPMDIERVLPLRKRREAAPGDGRPPPLEGAIIHVRPAPGLTARLLQRIADCHVAEAAVLVEPESWMSACPMFVPGAAAKVRSEGGHFIVEIRAEDTWAAEEILTRSLKAGRGSRASHARTETGPEEPPRAGAVTPVESRFGARGTGLFLRRAGRMMSNRGAQHGPIVTSFGTPDPFVSAQVVGGPAVGRFS